jgi:hypothetical protein
VRENEKVPALVAGTSAKVLFEREATEPAIGRMMMYYRWKRI